MNDSSSPTAPSSPPPIAASSVQPEHPPRPPLVLRVGVVGHRPDPKKRPDPDVAALREICRKLLRHVQDAFAGVASAHRDLFTVLPPRQDGNPPGLRLISALAEGADQWVASEAEQLGYELQTVLPFERTEYENDFANNELALAEHCRLRQLATVFELDGCRARPGESYLAAGRVLLNQTDLLIALWDGKGPQGTGQIVREALQRGVPVLWVNWEAPANWHLMRPAWRLLQQPVDVQGDFRLLTDQVMELLLPPAVNHNNNNPHNNNNLTECDSGETYFADRRRRWTLLGGWWNFFRDLLCGKPTLLAVHVPEFISTTQKKWHQDWEGGYGEKRKHKLLGYIIKWIEGNYLPHYAWATQLSVYYGNHYRSSFVWIYLLGALAVLLALLGMATDASHGWQFAFIIAESLVIGGIIGLTWYGRRRRWHERWIDYQTLAERLGLARFNCLLGGVWHLANVPSHLAAYGNPAATWMHWYARAVERSAGLPRVPVSDGLPCFPVNAEYLSACKELLQDGLIAGQEEYHKSNIVERLGMVDRRLHRFGAGLFLATLAACLLHLFVDFRGECFRGTAEAWGRWLTFCAAFLPALGAAMAAIRSQGEFHRLVQRSRAMSEELAQLRLVVATVPTRPDELNSQLLQQAAEQTTHLMYNEVLDWRIVFQDRPLVWPA